MILTRDPPLRGQLCGRCRAPEPSAAGRFQQITREAVWVGPPAQGPPQSQKGRPAPGPAAAAPPHSTPRLEATAKTSLAPAALLASPTSPAIRSEVAGRVGLQGTPTHHRERSPRVAGMSAAEPSARGPGPSSPRALRAALGHRRRGGSWPRCVLPFGAVALPQPAPPPRSLHLLFAVTPGPGPRLGAGGARRRPRAPGRSLPGWRARRRRQRAGRGGRREPGRPEPAGQAPSAARSRPAGTILPADLAWARLPQCRARRGSLLARRLPRAFRCDRSGRPEL